MTAPAAPEGVAVATRRLVAGALLAVTVVAGLAMHALLPDDAASDITGDALYAFAAYLAIVVIAPRLHALAVAGIALGWCIAVELFQFTGLPTAWGAMLPALRLVLGTAFDPRDLLVYTVAVIVACGADMAVRWGRRR